MAKKKKIAIICSSVAAVLLIAVIAGLCVAGSNWGWGPFGGLYDSRMKKLEGNSDKYAIQNVTELESSPLKGKNILFLGSSVTEGAASLGTSFADYIAKRGGAKYTKEAVNGTTLVNNSKKSYIERLKKIDKSAEYDLFVCQLSTNDAAKKYALDDVKRAVTDIIDYVKSVWDCPIVFFTNAYYDDAAYSAMTKMLNELRDERGIGVIDLYNDKTFNDISAKQRDLYMTDRIHPTRAGYLEWWTPKMEEYINEFISA